MKVEYSSNNSGGRWWLKDEDWLALEKAGWVVNWARNNKYEFARADANGRWLGALATSATRHGLSLSDAVAEFERVTKARSTDAGCPCCGQPHFFTEYDDSGKHVDSGPDISYEARW